MYVEYGDRNAQREKTRVQSKWADKNDGQEGSCLVNWFVFYDFFFLAVRKEDKIQTVVTVVGPVSDTFVLMMEMWWPKVGLLFLTGGKE